LVEPFVAVYLSGNLGSRQCAKRSTPFYYVARIDCQWRFLTTDFSPDGAAWGYFDEWRSDSTQDAIHARLRAPVHRREGRELAPSASSIDTQPASVPSGPTPRPTPGQERQGPQTPHCRGHVGRVAGCDREDGDWTTPGGPIATAAISWRSYSGRREAKWPMLLIMLNRQCHATQYKRLSTGWQVDTLDRTISNGAHRI
jgi:transposase